MIVQKKLIIYHYCPIGIWRLIFLGCNKNIDIRFTILLEITYMMMFRLVEKIMINLISTTMYDVLLNHSSNYILRTIIKFFNAGMEWRLDIYNPFNR